MPEKHISNPNAPGQPTGVDSGWKSPSWGEHKVNRDKGGKFAHQRQLPRVRGGTWDSPPWTEPQATDWSSDWRPPGYDDRATDAEFKESEHPREESGRFTEGAGTSPAAPEAKPESPYGIAKRKKFAPEIEEAEASAKEWGQMPEAERTKWFADNPGKMRVLNRALGKYDDPHTLFERKDGKFLIRRLTEHYMAGTTGTYVKTWDKVGEFDTRDQAEKEFTKRTDPEEIRKTQAEKEAKRQAKLERERPERERQAAAREAERKAKEQPLTPELEKLGGLLDKLNERDRAFAESLIGQHRGGRSLSDNQQPWVQKLTQRAEGGPAAGGADPELAGKIEELRHYVLHMDPRDQEFAGSLIQQHTDRGSLSDRQKPYIDKLLAKGRKLRKQWQGEEHERRAGQDATWQSPQWSTITDAQRRDPEGRFAGESGKPRETWFERALGHMAGEPRPPTDPKPALARRLHESAIREVGAQRAKELGLRHGSDANGQIGHWRSPSWASDAQRRDEEGKFASGGGPTKADFHITGSNEEGWRWSYKTPDGKVVHSPRKDYKKHHMAGASVMSAMAKAGLARGRQVFEPQSEDRALRPKPATTDWNTMLLRDHALGTARHIIASDWAFDQTIRRTALVHARHIIRTDNAHGRMAFDRAIIDNARDMHRHALASQRIRLAMDQSSVRSFSPDGHMHVALSNISRASVNPYWGREIPDAEQLGLDPNKKYMLWRHPEELRKAAQTFNGIPVLIDHKPISADDHPSELVVGSTGTDARYEHPFLKNSLHIWVKPAIDGVQNNERRELSCAYHYTPVMRPGVWEGKHFDGIMTGIKGNHVALVEAGRVGPAAVVADAMPFDLAVVDWFS